VPTRVPFNNQLTLPRSTSPTTCATATPSPPSPTLPPSPSCLYPLPDTSPSTPNHDLPPTTTHPPLTSVSSSSITRSPPFISHSPPHPSECYPPDTDYSSATTPSASASLSRSTTTTARLFSSTAPPFATPHKRVVRGNALSQTLPCMTVSCISSSCSHLMTTTATVAAASELKKVDGEVDPCVT
jgi:hypothetical protein